MQILLALAGVILVAYVPLFFAIAQVTRAQSFAYREESARALGRAVAAHVGDVAERDPASMGRRLESHVGEGGALAVAVYGPSGAVEASAGPPAEVAALRTPLRPYGEAATRVATRSGARGLDVVLPAGERAVLVRVRTDEDAARTADVVRGIALYMGVAPSFVRSRSSRAPPTVSRAARARSTCLRPERERSPTSGRASGRWRPSSSPTRRRFARRSTS